MFTSAIVFVYHLVLSALITLSISVSQAQPLSPLPLDGDVLPSPASPLDQDTLKAIMKKGREVCEQGCVQPFGTRLGEHEGVVAYSNCQASCIHSTYSWMNLTTKHLTLKDQPPHDQKLTYVGLTYQCVEYARRWWMHHHQITFGDVDSASDIIRLTSYLKLTTSPPQEQPLGRSVNGSAQRPPRRGDLLIYQAVRSSPRWRFGHVAVVVNASIEGGYVEVAEQNLTNTPWLNPKRYARRLKLTHAHGRYTITDHTFPRSSEPPAPILGWVYAPHLTQAEPTVPESLK